MWPVWPAGILGVVSSTRLPLHLFLFWLLSFPDCPGETEPSRLEFADWFVVRAALQVSLLQVFLSGLLPAHPVRLQAAVSGAPVHEHHPSPETGPLQRVTGMGRSNGSVKMESDNVTV